MANLDKVPEGHFQSEEPDDDMPDVYDRSRTVKSTDIQRSPNLADLQPGVYRPHETDSISEHYFRYNRMEIDSNTSNVDGNDVDISFKERNFPATDSEHRHKALGLSSEVREKVLRDLVADPVITEVLTAALAHANIAEPIIRNKELPSRRTENASNKAISERLSAHHPLNDDQKSFPSQNLSLSNDEVRKIGSLRDVDQVTKVLDLIKALGYSVHKDPIAEESNKEEHPKKYPTPEPSETEPTAPNSGNKSEPFLICSICSKLLDRPCKMK